MTWHYQLTREGDLYAIREVYRDKKGRIVGWTDNEIGAHGDSLEDVREDLQRMLNDIDRFVVLDITTGKEDIA